MSELVSTRSPGEPAILEQTGNHLRDLVRVDDWLPDAFAQPHPQYYQQYLLYGDPRDRFSVVSFVWGPGQRTPIHNHTIWGAIGMLRGSEFSQGFDLGERGQPPRASGPVERLEPGMVAFVSPSIGDVHRVWNAYDDRASISIHVYGGNIGRTRRQVFAEDNGTAKEFISGYSGDMVPNLWPKEP